MSDVGLDAQLDLDIRRALRAVDQLEDALNRATTVRVTADARAVTTSIEAAVEAAEVGVRVIADATDVSRSVDQAVDAADTNVRVTAETTGITPEIDAAIDAADETVDVRVDTTGARNEVRLLSREIDTAATSASRMRQILATVGAIGAARGLFEIAQAASDLNESTTKVQAVFQDLAPEIQNFARTAAQQLGLSETAALEAAGTFGNLLTALGLTRGEAVRLGPEMVQLGADLASFNNLDLDEALVKLRSGLVGEIEPLRQIGISFNAAQVEAKALELGLAGVSGEVSEAAKVQARWAIILEQSTNAQGDFARTSGGLANQQRILRAEFANMVTQVGQQILPAFLDLVQVARAELIPQLGELGSRVVPALIESATALAPLFGTALDVLVLLSPVISAVADALDAIPDPVLAAAAGAFIFDRAFGGLTRTLVGLPGALRALPALITGIAQPVPGAVSGVGGLARTVTGLGGAIGSLNPLLLAGGLAIGTFLGVMATRQAEQRRFRQEVEELTTALRDQDGNVRLTAKGLREYVEEQSRFNARNQIDDLARLGVGFDTLAGRVARSGRGLDDFVDDAVRSGEVTELWTNDINDLLDAEGNIVGRLGTHSHATRDLIEVNGRYLIGNTDLIKSFQELQEVMDAAAEEQIDLIRLSGQLAPAAIDAAISANTAADGTVNYAGALHDLNDELAAAAREEERAANARQRTLDTFGPLASSLSGAADAISRLRSEDTQLADNLQRLRSQGSGAHGEFLQLALGIERAGLSADQMQDVATALGLDLDTLTGFVDTLTGAIDDFVSTATGRLPDVAGVFTDTARQADQAAADSAQAVIDAGDERARIVEEQAREAGDIFGEARAQAIRDSAAAEAEEIERSGTVTADALAANLLAQAETIGEFRRNLARITEAGFADVAATVAEQGPELGGVLARELVTALDMGNTEILTNLSTATTAFRTEWQTTADFFRDTLGPQMVIDVGLVGRAITDSFGSELGFEERVRIASALARSGLTAEGQAVAAVAAVEGANAARAYGEALQLDEAVVDESIQAGLALQQNAPTGQASDAGFAVGASFSQGMAFGIAVTARGSAAAVTGAINFVTMTARAAAGIRSPSTVWAEIGREMTEGLALGLEQGTSEAVQAAVAVSDALAAAVADTTLSPQVLASVPIVGVPAGTTTGQVPQPTSVEAAGPAIGALVVPFATEAAAMRLARETIAEVEQERWRSQAP